MTQDQDVLADTTVVNKQPELINTSNRAKHAAAGADRVPWLVLALSVLAVVLWAVALPFVDVAAISGWGLLSGLPFLWYLAYLLALVALILAVVKAKSASARGRRLARAVGSSWVPPFVALALILFATTAVTYEVARFPWTYKHLGVTEYLLDHGTPNRDLDIYQNFPGFFYLMGFVHEVTQLPLMLMARWSELVFTLANAAAAYWAVGALSRSPRVRITTVVIFTLANWIGQTYYAPQALAFPLALVVLGVFLRLVAHGHGRPVQGRMLGDLEATASPADGRHEQFWARPVAVVVGLVLFAVIAVSHQFTPVALLVQIGLLTVVLRLRRPWLFPAMVAIEALWVLTAYPYLSSHFSLFQNFEFENLRPPSALQPVLPGSALMAQAPHVVTVLVALGTVAAVVRAVWRSRRLGSVLVPAVLALAPLAFVAVQPYGQEGILRAYLFGLPWCAFLIARDLLRVQDLSAGFTRAAAGTVALIGVLGLLAVPATLGNELIARVSPADVAADRWFEQNAPVGSELLTVAPGLPERSTGDYDRHVRLQDPLTPHTLSELRAFPVAARSSDGLLDLTDQYVRRQAGSHDIYLNVGPTQQAYLALYGLVSDQTYAGYVDGLKRDPKFTLVYDQGESFVFKVN